VEKARRCYNLVTLSRQEQPQSFEKLSPPAEQIRRLVERLAFQANRVGKSAGAAPVHDLRVAVRRLGSAIATYRVHLPRKPFKRIRKQLKTVLSAAGAVRDYDIAGEILTRTRQPGAIALKRCAHELRRENEKSLLRILKNLSLRTRTSKWCDNLSLNASPADFQVDTLEGIATGSLPRLSRRFFDAGERAARSGSLAELHNLRIRAKQFRYTLELFLPIYGGLSQDWVREVRSVQSILGAINDYRTVLSLATEVGCGNKLRAALKRSQCRKIRTFREVWTERFSGPRAAQWARSLRTPGGRRKPAPKPISASAAREQKALAKLG
jgi:CHAD domain-containing protein